MNEYKYSSPHDWLEARISALTDTVTGDGAAELFSIARTLALRIDADSLQDDFQSDMEQDGYFSPVGESPTDGDEIE